MNAITSFVSFIVVAMGAVESLSAATREPVPIGTCVANLRFKDIRYLPRELREFRDKRAYVVVCTNTTCPLVKRYWPKLNRLNREFRERGVQFVSLNVSGDETIPEIAAAAIEWKVDFPQVRDIDGECVRALGVTRTPEVVVLDQEFRLCYRGRIDDQYRLGGTRPAATREDLVEALEAVLAGETVARAETPVDGCAITEPRRPRVDAAVNFTEHIAPIMAAHCTICHRANTAAPFPLTQYDDVAGNGAMIAEVIAERRMPPWYASPADRQRFANYRGLTASERDTVLQWVAAGMPQGAVVELPEPPAAETWQIGEPDQIIRTIETHTLPAEGYVPYKYSVLPHVFLRDTWIRGIQILPDNPTVLHHANLIAIPLGGKLSDAYFITGKVPGSQPLVTSDGVAVLIPRGTALALQIHYTTTGKEERCRIGVGLKYASGRIDKQFRHVLVNSNTFAIPPGDGNHRVSAARTLDQATTGLGLFTHMHLRGKDMTYLAHLPDGTSQRLLTVPNYNFDWQMGYRWPPSAVQLPAGTRIEVIAHFDNSAFNPYNPDPTATVKEGRQTYHEMMYGFYFYTQDDEQLGLDVDGTTGTVK